MTKEERDAVKARCVSIDNIIIGIERELRMLRTHLDILTKVCKDEPTTEHCLTVKPKMDEFFRNPTAEERKAIADYIDSISVPTGVNVFDFMDEPQTTSTPYKVDTSSVCKTEPSNSEIPNNSKEGE